MKRLSILAPVALGVMCACNSRPVNQFDLKGSIEGADGQTIYLVYQNADSLITDSTVIADGKFAFSGIVDKPQAGNLFIGIPGWQSKTMLTTWLEPTEMFVTDLKADDFADAEFTGSITQSEAKEHESLVKSCVEQLKAIHEIQLTCQDPQQMAQLSTRSDSLRKEYERITLDFIRKHPSSYQSAVLIRQSSSGLSYKELKELYNALSPEVQSEAAEVGEELAALEATQPGNQAPELSGTDPDGKEIRLSDLKGKVVLIDFWATWCGPCRASLPHVKKLYDKYNAKGFEVLCVADDDSNIDGWKEVIKLEGMENYHNILRGLKRIEKNGRFIDFDRSTDQSAKYAVHYLPTKYLIATDGTIIGKIDSDEQLDVQLAEIFGE